MDVGQGQELGRLRGSLGVGQGLTRWLAPLFSTMAALGRKCLTKEKKNIQSSVSKSTTPVSGQPEPSVQAHVQSSGDQIPEAQRPRSSSLGFRIVALTMISSRTTHTFSFSSKHTPACSHIAEGSTTSVQKGKGASFFTLKFSIYILIYIQANSSFLVYSSVSFVKCRVM